jgi:Zn-finger nucleic acid-binding protein
MKCPKGRMGLTEINFKGVKIYECSGCKGTWLYSGEYDTLANIEKPVLERLFTLFRK